MRRPIAWMLAATLTLVLTAGCVTYDERIRIEPDGSGTVRVMVAISEDAMRSVEVDDNGKPLVRRGDAPESEWFPRIPDDQTGRINLSGRKAIEKDFASDHVKVRSVRVESSDGMRRIYVVADFDDFNKLPESRVFANRTMEFEKLPGGRYRIKQVVASDEVDKSPMKTETYQALKRQLGPDQAEALLKSYSVMFTIDAPGPVLEVDDAPGTRPEHQGKVWKNHKVIWTRRLYDVLGTGRLVMKVRAGKAQ